MPSRHGAGFRYDELVELLRERRRPPAPLQFDNGALAIRVPEREHLALMACQVVNKKLAAHIDKYDGQFAPAVPALALRANS